jgi:outer membrane biosynthesis protein TonB
VRWTWAISFVLAVAIHLVVMSALWFVPVPSEWLSTTQPTVSVEDKPIEKPIAEFLNGAPGGKYEDFNDIEGPEKWLQQTAGQSQGWTRQEPSVPSDRPPLKLELPPTPPLNVQQSPRRVEKTPAPEHKPVQTSDVGNLPAPDPALAQFEQQLLDRYAPPTESRVVVLALSEPNLGIQSDTDVDAFTAKEGTDTGSSGTIAREGRRVKKFAKPRLDLAAISDIRRLSGRVNIRYKVRLDDQGKPLEVRTIQSSDSWVLDESFRLALFNSTFDTERPSEFSYGITIVFR